MKYEEVPDIITGKDLDYLSDMFNWNFGAYKKAINFIDMIENEEIKKIYEKATDLFNDNINLVLDLIGGTND